MIFGIASGCRKLWITLKPAFLCLTKFKICFVDLPFSVFFCFLSKKVQTDQNVPFFCPFWLSSVRKCLPRLPFCLLWTIFYDTSGLALHNIKQPFEGKVGKREFAQHFIESAIELAKVLGKYEPDHFTKAYLPFSVFYSAVLWILSIFRITEEWRL